MEASRKDDLWATGVYCRYLVLEVDTATTAVEDHAIPDKVAKMG
jgi:hypothetical protein